MAKESGEYIADANKQLKSENEDVCGITLNTFDLSSKIVKELINHHCTDYQ